MSSAGAAAGAGKEYCEITGGYGFGGGEPGRERQPVHVGAGREVGEFGERRGVREDRRREKAGGAWRAAGSG
ncbi:hypothetical protein ACFWV1_11115 [Streptomyces sp. NPDC058700]|uniref:hypothetical protein n=1 Tax=unclassified Streptomyces TaxID=2593676 RepID=UPI003657BAAB